jgi:hypothetical protein
MRAHGCTDHAFAEKPRLRMYFSFSISALWNSSLEVVAVRIGLSSVLFSMFQACSAAIRAARYELIILQVWLSGASSWFRCSNASGMWQCARAEVPHEAERLWVIHWFAAGYELVH